MLGRLSAAAGSLTEAATAAVTELTAAEEDGVGDVSESNAPQSPATQQGATKKKLESATREDLVQFVKKQAVKMKSLEGMGAELAQERRVLDARIVGLSALSHTPFPDCATVDWKTSRGVAPRPTLSCKRRSLVQTWKMSMPCGRSGRLVASSLSGLPCHDERCLLCRSKRWLEVHDLPRQVNREPSPNFDALIYFSRRCQVMVSRSKKSQNSQHR